MRALEPAGRTTTIVRPARPAPSAACLSADEVRRALWRVHLSTLRRCAIDASGSVLMRGRVREHSGMQAHPSEVAEAAQSVTASLLLHVCGVGTVPRAAQLFDALVCRGFELADPQVTALALWAASITRDRRARELFARLTTLAPAVLHTTELGWMLSAACRYEMTTGENGRVADFADALASRLLANQRRSGLFCSGGDDALVNASLASQTHAIAGLAAFAEMQGDRGAAHRSSRRATLGATLGATLCADRLCAMQGPLGQWWSRYDVSADIVVERYPVSAMMQDGAVPLALGALQRVLGDRRYDQAVNMGLQWEGGDNEIGESLIDERRGIVAGSIERVDSAFRAQRDMHVCQPAWFVLATLSDPLWSAQAVA